MESSTEILRALLDERGMEYEAERIDFSNYFTWGENDCYSYTEYPDGTVLRIWDCTPEQAIAATLGGVPDEIELTQTYDAGFRNGVMAVFQQLEGIEDYEGLQDLIAEYWGEGEGNDER